MNILIDVFLIGLVAFGLWGVLMMMRDAWRGSSMSRSPDRCACRRQSLIERDSLDDGRTRHARDRCQPLREVIR